MSFDKFNNLCKRFAKLDIDGMDKDDQVIFLMAFASFLAKIEPLLNEYVPKETKNPKVRNYRFGIDGKIEPLE